MEEDNTFGINLGGAATSVATPETQEEIKLEDLLTPTTNGGAAEYLTDEEQRDVNSIQIGISRNIPIVILFGARASGKTMALVRLSRWLENNGYSIEPVRDFRPSNSKHYEKMCNEFSQNIHSSTAQDANNVLSFMLAEVSKDGKSICQILEAPGEHYFDEEMPDMDFPTYIKGLKNAKVNGKRVPKTWVFIVECKWKGFEGQAIRPQYAKQIVKMFRNVSADDRIILLCHKADKQGNYFVKDNPVKSKFLADIKSDYAPMFEKLSNNFFERMFRPETFKYDFVVFSAGEFNKRADGLQQYTESDDKYPADLWRAIRKSVFN